MIVKLLPQQIESLWDSIRFGIIKSLAPTVDITATTIRNILCQLMRGDIQCWCIYGEDKDIYGYVTTSIIIDANTKDRTLLIYSFSSQKQMSLDMWEDGLKAIEKYARVNMCSIISAYTSNQSIVEITKTYGYNTDYTYITKSLTEEN